MASEKLNVVTIQDDDVVYRRLSLRSHIRPDNTVASNAYKLNKKPDPEPSVDLARLATPEECVARIGRPGFSVGVLKVSELRARGFEVWHKPTTDNPAHCIIEGNVSMETCYLLAECTTLLIVPNEPPVEEPKP